MWVMKDNLWDRLMCFSNCWHLVQFMDKATSHSHIVATFVSQVPFFLSFVSRNDIFNPATMHQTGTHGQGESWCLSPGPVNRAQWLMAWHGMAASRKRTTWDAPHEMKQGGSLSHEQWTPWRTEEKKEGEKGREGKRNGTWKEESVDTLQTQSAVQLIGIRWRCFFL